MKLSILLSLAAVAVTAIEQTLPGEELVPEDVVLTEADLDALESGTPIEARSPSVPVVMRPVSTQCAARPRGGAARRSLEEEGLAWAYEELETRASGKKCSTSGHLKSPGPRTFIKGIKQQRCANTCVCRSNSAGGNGCKTFSWVPNGMGTGRGRCILYRKTLDQMGYADGPGDAQHPTRSKSYPLYYYVWTLTNQLAAFWSRSCYHKGQPYPTAVQTNAALAARATPPPMPKRDVTLSDDLVNVLAGI